MTENTSNSVAITLDTRKPRIRIYKSTVHLMGNPKYIQLLVNPTERLIALHGVDRHIPGQDDLKVSRQMADVDDNIDWYSKYLVAKLCDAFQEIRYGSSYNLFGNIVPDRWAVFPLSSITEITPNMGELYAKLIDRFNHR